MMLSRRYKQMIGRCALLLVAGTALQLFRGDADTSLLSYPWSLVVAINYLYILILLYAKSDSMKFVRRLYERPAYLTSLTSMLVLTLLFGLIRQDGSTDGLWGVLGFTRMSSSWIFVLFLVHFMTVVGLKTIEDIYRWKQRKLPAVVMHSSFFFLLVSAVFGSGEKIRVKVTTALDTPTRIGITDKGKMYELPFTLTLKEFILEEYPPQIYIIDGEEQVMHRREIKKFLSKVNVTDGNSTKDMEIWVNHPACIGTWRIYQSGYDNTPGKRSSISILECVNDRWYPMAHIAMWMILAGALMMFFVGHKKNK